MSERSRRHDAEATVYLLHFGATGTLTPYRHAGHYLGWTEDLDQRLKALGGHARICPLCRSIRAKGEVNG